MALGGEVVKDEQAVQQTQLRVSGAGGRDSTGMDLLDPRDFKFGPLFVPLGTIGAQSSHYK